MIPQMSYFPQFSLDMDAALCLVFRNILSLCFHFSHGPLTLSGWDE